MGILIGDQPATPPPPPPNPPWDRPIIDLRDLLTPNQLDTVLARFRAVGAVPKTTTSWPTKET